MSVTYVLWCEFNNENVEYEYIIIHPFFYFHHKGIRVTFLARQLQILSYIMSSISYFYYSNNFRGGAVLLIYRKSPPLDPTIKNNYSQVQVQTYTVKQRQKQLLKMHFHYALYVVCRNIWTYKKRKKLATNPYTGLDLFLSVLVS